MAVQMADPRADLDFGVLASTPRPPAVISVTTDLGMMDLLRRAGLSIGDAIDLATAAGRITGRVVDIHQQTVEIGPPASFYAPHGGTDGGTT